MAEAGALAAADRAAVDKLLAVWPQWSGQSTVGEQTDCAPDTLLHAGPGFDSPAAITRPILNSARVAAVYQGLAADFEQAEIDIRNGRIPLAPTQDYGIVTPLAAVLSRSMPVHVVGDAHAADNRACAPLNGGSGAAMRLGVCNDAVLAHLRWLNGDFARQLERALSQQVAPIDLIEMAREALMLGDDCHGRTVAATRLLTAKIAAALDARAGEFLHNSPGFFLNLWMAAVKCMLRAAEGTRASSLVTTAGANGATTGIQLAGLPGRWFTANAEAPSGALEIALPEARKLGAIGDSAIIDNLGLGAMAMRFSPVQESALGRYLPADGLQRPARILADVHPGFGAPGLRVGTLASAVCGGGGRPLVSLGILDRDGQLGRLGGGIFEQPAVIYQQAVAALDSTDAA